MWFVRKTTSTRFPQINLGRGPSYAAVPLNACWLLGYGPRVVSLSASIAPIRSDKRTGCIPVFVGLFSQPHEPAITSSRVGCFSGNFQLFLAFDTAEVSQCAQTSRLHLGKPTEWGIPMYRVAEGVRSTHGQDGAIVLDIRQGQMFNLNLVGSRILELLETGSTQSAIVDEISQKFEVSREIAESDVREFVESLKQHHLLEDSGSNDQP